MPWLRLLRLPTVFTALGNVLCGVFVSQTQRSLPEIVTAPWFWLLLLASSGLYLGGMVLNDVFDAALDARERPERPIPAGQISTRAAAMLGWGLLGSGVLCAALAGLQSQSGSVPVGLAILLAAAVVLYDGALKSTVLGPLGMGVCRGLNILLGASCAGDWSLVLSNPQATIAVALGVYVFGVTWFARHEAGEAPQSVLILGVVFVMVGLGIDVRAAWASSTPNGRGATLALALVAVNIARRSMRAIAANQPRLLQKTVGFMLLNIIFIDAAMVFFATGSPQKAACVVILVVPATLMKRFIPLS